MSRYAAKSSQVAEHVVEKTSAATGRHPVLEDIQNRQGREQARTSKRPRQEAARVRKAARGAQKQQKRDQKKKIQWRERST